MSRFHIVEHVDQSSIRLYLKSQHSDKPYENREDYEVLFTVNYETPEVAYCSKWISKVELKKQDILDINSFLYDRGIRVIRMQRKGVIQERRLDGKV